MLRHIGFCMCVLIPQKYIFKIIITLTSSYCDEIFHNDMHSHFFLCHASLDRIDWISLIDYHIPKITMMSFIVLCRTVTITKQLFFCETKLSIPLIVQRPSHLQKLLHRIPAWWHIQLPLCTTVKGVSLPSVDTEYQQKEEKLPFIFILH